MNTHRQWLLRERPEGMPGREHFEFRESAVPAADDGQLLVRNL